MPAEPFAERVLQWYDRHGRHELPWQRPATPYRVWISEIMLQQTRVETVGVYFERFLHRFPDIATLATAAEDEVLACWAGLGYYARARNLHRAAGLVVECHGGELPDEFDALVALPGIGRSTAGAILSLAHGQRHAILDGNVKRVLARHRGIEGWPGQTGVAKQLWAAAEANTPGERVGAYNQAMMDLGSAVCVRRPRCGDCPVAGDCRAHADGTTDRIPAPKPRREQPRRETLALVLQRSGDGAILLERRPPEGIWGGLWSLPEFVDHESLMAWLGTRLGISADPEVLAPVEHAFTHFRLCIQPRRVVVDRVEAIADGEAHDWCTAKRSPGGLPAPVRRIVDHTIATLA